MNASETMTCEKYHARIPVSTCIARQNGGAKDPGCADCDQGKDVKARLEAAGGGNAADSGKTEGEIRICRVCQHPKPLMSDYPKNRMYKDGYETICKQCKKERAKNRPGRKNKTESGEKLNKTDRKSTGKHIITLDFSRRTDLYAKLLKIAEHEIRTVEDQLFYLTQKEATDA